MSKYADSDVQVLVTHTAKCTTFAEQKEVLNDLTKGELSEFNYNELLAKLRHLSINDPNVKYNKAPEYQRVNKEPVRSKALLVTDCEQAIENILQYPVELDSLVNANRIDIVTILKAFNAAQTVDELSENQ